MYYGERSLLEVQRKLRRAHNPWELRLWYHLRAGRFHGLKFKRQVQIGNYIVDFSCREKMLIVELDGGHHADQKEGDKVRQCFLESQGFTVLRFWNNEVDKNTEGVLIQILEFCK
jgi:very-short-patch-repair endonuclease